MKKTPIITLLLLFSISAGCSSFFDKEENMKQISENMSRKIIPKAKESKRGNDEEDNKNTTTDESRDNSCLTSKNFNLVKNFILENGEKIQDKNYPSNQDVYLFKDANLLVRYRVINENLEQLSSGFDIIKGDGRVSINTKRFSSREAVKKNYQEMLSEFCDTLEKIRGKS